MTQPARSKWVVQPYFDEGDDWPESSGMPHIIEADTREAATEAFPTHEYTSLAWLDTMTPAEWFERGSGYPLEGLDG
jgi:hypothetical protein